MGDTEDTRVPVTVLTGFLGAGKVPFTQNISYNTALEARVLTLICVYAPHRQPCSTTYCPPTMERRLP